METIDPELLMIHACQVYKRSSGHGHLDFKITNASEVSGTLHFGVAVRSQWLSDEIIDGLLAACKNVAESVLGVEFEGTAYVPRNWKPTDRPGQPGQTDEDSAKGVLQPEQEHCEPVRESELGTPVEESRSRSGRGRRKRSSSEA